ncbi:hypothetical protein FRB94_011959 [Tulasnella sp. JGI-2019a]|nr:hypothetical protein FRB93_012723 [Tulasnella sp. JGI-2019a]KAG9009542.1 hypothetical protein FRB94_011959 [Tulasnella sp. JGI-2019a]KAG9034544.1 hypothetical protein FRB95_013111 [Tulasnella sp. JGI-2019a]
MATTELSQQDLESILDFSVEIAGKAGALILEGSQAIRQHLGGSTTAVDEKKNSVDLVTEYDVKVEDLVRREISSKYPNFGFIGEESFSKGIQPELTDEPMFCVDPIDGTTNFIHGFPFSCISIGLIYKQRPVIGIIFNPFLQQLYFALKGSGAYLNSRATKLPLSPPGPLLSLSNALIGVEWGSDRSDSIIRLKSESFVRLGGDPKGGVTGGRMAHGMRSLGSAALNHAMVASGSMDLYWEIGCWAWDVCAGVVIAQEAGGFVSGGREAAHDGECSEKVLLGRKYIVVRAIADTPEEKGFDAQKRIVREFYDAVEDWTPV